MNIPNRILETINKLEDSISYADWDIVEDTIKDLMFLHEELESDFPLEFDMDDNDLY